MGISLYCLKPLLKVDDHPGFWSVRLGAIGVGSGGFASTQSTGGLTVAC